MICYMCCNVTFNKVKLLSGSIENTFFYVLLPKSKQILTCILYRPAKQVGFLNNVSLALTSIPDFDSREIYILGDININLLCHGQNGNKEVQRILCSSRTNSNK